jgi:uncharacterized protein (TIGR01777 family)
MRILVTGGTGFLGRPLCAALVRAGHQVTVLSRTPSGVADLCGAAVESLASLDAWTPEITFDAVINLAGAPIVDVRWSESRKRLLRDSRIALTDALMRRIAACDRKPAVLLSGSAVGFYGDGGDLALDEHSPAGTDFAARLCADWETAASQATAFGVRVCFLRTGLVLHPSNGILGRLVLPFRLGLGGKLGTGTQWMSWIHRDDWIALAVRLLADRTATGAFNLTAPAPVANATFTRLLGHVLRRPVIFSAPEFLLRAALGERAQMLLAGQRALPRKAELLGFTFAHPELEDALRSLLG